MKCFIQFDLKIKKIISQRRFIQLKLVKGDYHQPKPPLTREVNKFFSSTFIVKL